MNGKKAKLLVKWYLFRTGEERLFLCPVSVTMDGGAVANLRQDVELSDRDTKTVF